MIKRLCLALAGLFAFVSLAQGAGTVPGFSLTPQFDLSGKVMPGCKLAIIQAGTTATPQVAYQDSALTIPSSGGSNLVCDAAGRLPQFFVADGLIKLRLTDKNGTQVFVGDNLTVVGASSGGGGGGGTVDPTTVLATGDIKVSYRTGVLTGFVRSNGRTIGSATSGATERANADCQALFQFLWGFDANLTVSGGRGASAAADWAANKTIVVPDFRGAYIAGLADMGNTPISIFTSTYFGSDPTVLGNPGGSQKATLGATNLPPYTPSGTVTTNFPATVGGNPPFLVDAAGGCCIGYGGASTGATPRNIANLSIPSTFTGAATPGTSTPFATLPPSRVVSIYMKL